MLKKFCLLITFLLVFPSLAAAGFSSDVQKVQKQLISMCYNPGPADGYWGAKTNRAVKKLYETQNKSFDGTLDPDDISLIEEIFSNKSDNQNCKTTTSPSPVIAKKLAQRRTINVFNAWNKKYGLSDVGLFWTALARGPNNNTILLRSLGWNYHYAGQNWEWSHPRKNQFTIDKNYHGDWTQAKFGTALALDFTNPEFQDIFTDVAAKQIKASQTDGVMLDWWHPNHKKTGLSKSAVNKARLQLAKKLRKALGEGAIILGNVNYYIEKATVSEINGVYLELNKQKNKSDTKRTYNRNEFKKIENSLKYYNQNLRAPKLIAVEARRKTLSVSNSDRNSQENRKMAKLLTAMTTVIADNGYINYVDNDLDDLKSPVRDFMLYDFYSFDIGKPTSPMTEIKKGVGYKIFENGIIAYNITSRDVKFNIFGSPLTIEASSGLFCSSNDGSVKCLSSS